MAENIFVFLFGSIIGSFLNVCIYRMPLNESVVTPGSHCPNCKKAIPWYDNIPFVSYCLLLARCRFCKKIISPRYLLVELLTGLSFLTMFIRFGLSFDFFLYTLFICGLIVSTFIDIGYRIIPDEISVGGIVAGLLLSLAKSLFIAHNGAKFSPLIDSCLGIIVGGGIIYLTGFLFDVVYFKMLKKPAIQGETESMGGGDVKLLAMIGGFLGWKIALFTFFIAPFFGAVVGLINMAVKKDHTIPYGPFLSLAAVIGIFWMDAVLKLLLLH
jgi:leader peptidase (prepilin peptidase) / N-methyltransferase